jgi:hypothetical protein
MGCGADVEANSVMASLLAGKSFTIPTVDLDGADYTIPASAPIVLPAAPTNADLTAATLEGSGTFDTIMRAINAHLKNEFDKSRITGAEYAKVYLGSMEAALGNSVQFLLQRDQSYWTAVRAQYEARIAEAKLIQARVELATAKVQLAALQYTALTQEATYALTKMKLATESVQYCIGQYNLDYLLPVQKKSAEEQMEAARAQTMNTRSDGVTPIVGLIGKQKDLYTQQITSYQRDSEVKAAKLFTDAWITMKTIDEGLLPPTNFNNASLDLILGDLKTNNNLG